jgi:MFS family permease
LTEDVQAATSDGGKPARRGLFFGWYIVAATVTLAVYSGGVLFYGFSAYFKAIDDEFGWGRAVTSVAYGLINLEGGAMAPILGWIIDRYGTRIPLVVGVSIAGGGFILLSQMNSLLTFYIGFVIVALGFSVFFSAPTAAVANWFIRKRSRAMGVALMGYGFSGLVVPVLVWVISSYGWRTAFFAVGLLTWGLCLPLVLIIRHRPENHGYLPDGDTELYSEASAILSQGEGQDPHILSSGRRPSSGLELSAGEAVRTPAFWLLTIGFALSFVVLGAITPHMITYLSGIGIVDEVAALGITGMTLGSVVGRLGFGFLGDYFEKRYLIAGCFASMAVGTVIFASISEAWHLIPFLLFLGPAYGGPIPLRFALQGDYFGTKAFALISGLMMLPGTLIGFFSPVFAGWMFDTTGSYRLAFLILAAITAAGIPFILLARPPAPSGSPAEEQDAVPL